MSKIDWHLHKELIFHPMCADEMADIYNEHDVTVDEYHKMQKKWWGASTGNTDIIVSLIEDIRNVQPK